MALSYNTGWRGLPGYLVRLLDQEGVSRGTVIPAVSVVDQNGGSQPAGTVSDPLYIANAEPATPWRYAPPAGGITNSTAAVQIKAAAGAGLRNYITSMQVSTGPLGAGTELVMIDTSGSVIIWRCTLGTGGTTGIEQITFATPIFSSANAGLNIQTLTATGTGSVLVDAQGYVAA